MYTIPPAACLLFVCCTALSHSTCCITRSVPNGITPSPPAPLLYLRCHTPLQAAFLSVLSHESEAVSARPHMLETAAPALQGPLNSGAESLKQRALRSVACTLALSTGGGASSGLAGLSLNPGSGSGQGSGFSVVATGFSNGSVYAHALELGQVLPVWLDGAPQCAYDKKGEVAAVRYEVEAVPCAPAAAGEGVLGWLECCCQRALRRGAYIAGAAAAGSCALSSRGSALRICSSR